jgi:hypothetical protein
MSLYKDASLVMIPTAYKDGRLYSIRPTDGSGDFGFSRGSNLAATRVDVNGLIEKGRENLLLQSNNFGTTWTNVSTTETGGQSGYDGSSDAWLITKSGANGRLDQTISASGVLTFSIYAKANALNWIYLRIDGSGGNHDVYFDLVNGAVGINNLLIDSDIQSVGNGYYRCSVSFNDTISVVRVYPADGDGNRSGTSGSIYIQDAQLEQGLVATDYIETTTTSVSAGILEDMPRLDYSGGASCPSLLLEPSRTNLIPQSEYFGGYTLVNVTADANNATSPEGVQNAYKIVEDSANTNKHFRAANTTLTASTYAVSAFIKPNNCDVISLREGAVSGDAFTYKFSTGGSSIQGSRWNGATIEAEDYGNGWYRISANFTATTGASHNFRIHLLGNEFNQTTNPSVGTYTYTGDGASGIWVYGFQAEQGSYPTSYIPTYGTSQTRSVDSCLATGVSDLIGQTEGTLFVEYNSNVTEDDSFFIVADDGTANNRIVLYSNTPNNLALVINNGGVLQVVIANITLATGTNKFAVGYANNDVVLYLNGTQVGIDNTATIPATSALRMGTDNTGAAYASGKATKQALVFKTRLSNAELAALTTL